MTIQQFRKGLRGGAYACGFIFLADWFIFASFPDTAWDVALVRAGDITLTTIFIVFPLAWAVYKIFEYNKIRKFRKTLG